MKFTVLAICIGLIACSPAIFEEEDCSNDVVSSAISTDGQLVASLVRRDCGSTAVHSNLVFLRKAYGAVGKKVSFGEAVYVSQGEMSIEILWIGADLSIKAPTVGGDVFLKRDEWHGIGITYK